MTAEPPTRGIDAHAAATIDAAARYITGQLTRQRLLQATDPHGWDLARRLALLADTLTGDGDTATWVEANPAATPTATAHTQPHQAVPSRR